MSLALGCAMVNPAFDERDELAEGEVGDGDGDGDGDTSGDGDGDGDPGTSTTETGDGDGDPGCPIETPDLCGDICTNLDTDPSNCGICGMQCTDACIAGTCERERIIFATGAVYSGALGGISGSDEKCYYAASTHYPNKGFVAWNSTAQLSPNSSLQKDGYFVRTDGALIAESWAKLTDGQLDVPISFDESGQEIPNEGECAPSSSAWTGTSLEGDLYPGPNCQDWYYAEPDLNGTFGDLHATDARWTVGKVETCIEPPRCNQLRHIYCIEY